MKLPKFIVKNGYLFIFKNRGNKSEVNVIIKKLNLFELEILGVSAVLSIILVGVLYRGG